jgi:hypothetical protein
MYPFTLNAHLGYANTSNLLRDIQRIRPAVVLAYLDKRDNAWILDEIEKVNPQGRLVVRMFHQDDYRFHLDGIDRGYVKSPQSFINEFSWAQGPRRWVQVMNEPSGYENKAKLNAWFTEVMELCPYPLAVFNFATGHPADSNGRWVNDFDGSIRTLNKYRKKHLACLHEYGPGTAYRIGRYRQFHNRCKDLGISPLPVFINEWGVDAAYDGDPLNGYKSRGWDSRVYYEQLLYWYNNFYLPEVKAGLVYGMSIFSYGNSGGWQNFDIEGTSVIDYIANEGPKDLIKMNTAPEYPSLLPVDSPSWKRVKISLPYGPVNYRSVPSVVGNVPIGTLKVATVLDYADLYQDLAWVQVKFMDGTRGWMSRQYIRVEPMDTFSALITATGLSIADFEKLTEDMKTFLDNQNFVVEVKPL